jgi:hypothetical protein
MGTFQRVPFVPCRFGSSFQMCYIIDPNKFVKLTLPILQSQIYTYILAKLRY